MKTIVCRVLLSFAAIAVLFANTGAQLRRTDHPGDDSRLLVPSDFEYQGMFRAPIETEGGGALTGRVSDGQLSLMMLNKSQLLFEFEVPPSFTFDGTTAPRAAVIKKWGFPNWNLINGKTGCDVLDSDGCWKRQNISWNYETGELRETGNSWHIHGILYRENKLYWSYLDFYNSSFGPTDHALGVTDLSPGQSERTGWAKPPWRFEDANVKLLAGNLLPTPEGLGLVGSFGAISRNTDNSHGPAFSVMPYPTLATPGGYRSPPLRATTKLSYSISDKAPREADYRPDTANPYNPDRMPENGVGFWTQRDRMTVAVWIETTSGHRGLLFVGGLATGQLWYGSWDEGPRGVVNKCKSSERGENAENFRPEWRIYDPSQLNGGHTPAVHTVDPRSLTNGQRFDWLPCEQYMTAGYFDRESGRLFLAGGSDPDNGAVSLIHIWNVK